MLRWMFFEQYHHEPNIATLRFWLAFVGSDALSDVQRDQIPARRIAGEAALQQMDDHLALKELVRRRRSEPRRYLPVRLHPCSPTRGGFDLSLYPQCRGMDRANQGAAALRRDGRGGA